MIENSNNPNNPNNPDNPKQCQSCLKEDVCKYCGDYKRARKSIESVKWDSYLSDGSSKEELKDYPWINVEISCRNFFRDMKPNTEGPNIPKFVMSE